VRTEHVDDELLEAFALGALGERTAVLVAEHLDACPGCANRARLADPLSTAFASFDDPVVPPDLVTAILAAETARPPVPWAELAVAAGLVLAAAGVAWRLAGPSTWWAEAWWAEAIGVARGLAAVGAHATAAPDALVVLAAVGALSALGAWRLGSGGVDA
jgi:hypothetical protein